MGAEKGYGQFRINGNGLVETLDQGVKPYSLYFSQLQFAGAVEPNSYKPGLKLLPDYLVYNGLTMDFLASFAHYRNNARLHFYKAVFLERDSILIRDVDEMKIAGKGHVITFKAEPIGAEDKEVEFKVEQFAPGESWAVGVKSGSITQKDNGVLRG